MWIVYRACVCECEIDASRTLDDSRYTDITTINCNTDCLTFDCKQISIDDHKSTSPNLNSRLFES